MDVLSTFKPDGRRVPPGHDRLPGWVWALALFALLLGAALVGAR